MDFKEALEKHFGKIGFYHFTDARNIPGIVAAGAILSRRESKRLNQKIEAIGGNEWSVEADDRIGMDAYVHLCFTRDHPMEFLARQQGRIESSRYLSIAAEVLEISGVLCTLDVSNKAGVEPISIEDACRAIDFEVLYHHTEWKDPAIKARLQKVRKYEILVPTKIPIALVSGL